MFKHAVRHPTKKAQTDIRNNSDLSPLTLAAKLGRKEIFLECLELSHVVSFFIIIFTQTTDRGDSKTTHHFSTYFF